VDLPKNPDEVLIHDIDADKTPQKEGIKHHRKRV